MSTSIIVLFYGTNVKIFFENLHLSDNIVGYIIAIILFLIDLAFLQMILKKMRGERCSYRQ